MKGHIDDFRLTLGVKIYHGDSRYTYNTTFVWTTELAMKHKFGKWGEWVTIPFLFLPKKSIEGKWVWGRGIQMRIRPTAVSFTDGLATADVMYDTKKNIFMRKLKGGA